ncbi:hypothetical protein [Pseudopelagicola sp. nBUS_19]|uniref:hypothetical protein n=1 Tax=Pseudopelagicola sp. nBUS_19 TaxID=3395316 RepID=UPI003EBFF584
MRSIGLIGSGLEEIVAFLVGEEITNVTDRAAEVVVGPCGCSPGKGLEFGEGHFDWTEIGTVWRQEEKSCPERTHGFGSFLAFVRGQVVEDNHITCLQGRCQLGLDIKLEQLPVHSAVNHPGRCCQTNSN